MINQRILIIIVSLFLPIALFAGNQSVVKTFPITAVDGATIPMSFPQYADYGNFDEKKYLVVDLSYTRDFQSDLTLDYPFVVELEYDLDGVSQDPLKIEYKSIGDNHIYTDYAVHELINPLASLEVTSVKYYYYDGTSMQLVAPAMYSAYLPNDIRLLLRWQSERYYELDSERPLRLYANHNFPDHKIDLRWRIPSYIQNNGINYDYNWNGSEAYELEWVFIDKESEAFDQIDYNNPELQFELKEPARVTLRFQHYELDDEFREGEVFFRVRSVGRYTITEGDDGKHEVRKYTDWQYHSTVPDLGEPGGETYLTHIKIDQTKAFESDKNWQYVATYSDYGDHSRNVSYFDGTLRARQSMAYNAVDEVTLVSEQKYDHEGRASISVIPGMVKGKDFHYHSLFNGTFDGSSIQEFTADNFDKNNPDPIVPAPSYIANNGAAQYYSIENNFTEDRYRDRVDNAEGRVYSQTRYKKDGTGRLVSTRGVGETFSDALREQKYYYGTPTKRELVELMGSDIGDPSYYRKHVVRDANGQHSFKIVDNLGNTVISGLTGIPPSNLHDLQNTPTYVTSPIVTSNVVNNSIERTSEHVEVVLGTQQGGISSLDYGFEYDMTPVIYGVVDPVSIDPLCVSCKYKLEFKVIGPDGTLEPVPSDALAFGSVTTAGVQEYSFSASSLTCGSGLNTEPLSANTGSGGLTKIPLGTYPFSGDGEYRIIKKLTIDLNSTQNSIDVSNYYSYQDYLDEALANVDTSGCFQNCESFCEAYAKYNYEQESGLLWDNLSAGVQQSKIDDCTISTCDFDPTDVYGDPEEDDLANDPNYGTNANPINQCSGMLLAMKQQVRPGGVEFESQDFRGFVEDAIEDDEIDLFTAGNVEIDGSFSLPSGYNSYIEYLFDENNFREAWVDDLVLYHREYCHYDICTELSAANVGGLNSYEFDLKMMSQDVWSTYNNPSGGLDDHSSLWPQSGSTVDPFTTTDANGGPQATFETLQERLVDIDLPSGGTGDLNAYIVDAQATASMGTTNEEMWSVLAGQYQIEKFYVIEAYVDHLNGDDQNNNAYYTQGCAYYNDDDAIVPGNELDANNDGVVDIPGPDQNIITGAGVLALHPDCQNVCSDNVTMWLNMIPNSCITTLQNTQPGASICGVNGNSPCPSEWEELEVRLYDYCIDHCTIGNPGWLYDDGSTEFDAIESLLMCNGVNPLDGSIVDPPTPVPSVNACLSLFVDYFNNILLPCLQQNISNVSNCDNTAILPSHPFYDCIFPGESKQIVGLDYFVHTTVSSLNVIEFSIENTEPGSASYGESYVFRLEFSVDLSNLTPIVYLNAHDEFCAYRLCEENNTNNVVQLFIQNPLGFVDCIFDTETPIEVWNLDDPAPYDPQDCIDAVIHAAELLAEDQLVTDQLNLQNQFLNVPCMEIEELLTMTYHDYGNYYTLYYYDQTNNLVATVPPKGVDKLDDSKFDGDGVWNGNDEPEHKLFTSYQYNGLNQLISKVTPESGTTYYYYDDDKRLRFSESTFQKLNSRLSFVKYDNLGRTIANGEVCGIEATPTTSHANDLNWPEKNDFANNNLSFKHLTEIFYDKPYDNYYYNNIMYSDFMQNGIAATFEDGKQKNMRNRVATTLTYNFHKDNENCNNFLDDGNDIFYDNVDLLVVSSYSYDEHGNVDELVQSVPMVGEYFHQHIAYDYDLLTGNVNDVIYQEGYEDEFRHHYDYDANNRLVRVFTSNDGVQWERDAKYFYGLDGTMVRTEIGHDKVQGVDYAYNLQGWQKGVNSTTLKSYRDLGKDAKVDHLNQYIGTDVYGYSLGYHDDDYNPIGGGAQEAFANTSALQLQNGNYDDLYNGNISHMVTAMRDNNENVMDILGNNYQYDLLQRIRTMDVYHATDLRDNNNFSGATAYNGGAYATSYSYDLNGNIRTLTRNGNDGNQLGMDDLLYYYYDDQGNTQSAISGNPHTNQLANVKDFAPNQYGGIDLQSQMPANYTYDEDGRLITDAQEGIVNIEWTVDNKVQYIDFDNQNTNKNDLRFVYDANGNRIIKYEYLPAIYDPDLQVKKVEKATYYIRDAQGNVMATYIRKKDWDYNSDLINSQGYRRELYLEEQMIYGAKRLGSKNPHAHLVTRTTTITTLDETDRDILDFGIPYPLNPAGEIEDSTEHYEGTAKTNLRKMGLKRYELSNHLGNVLNVVTDLKLSAETEQVIYDNTFDSWNAVDEWTFQPTNQNAGLAFNPMLNDEVILGSATFSKLFPTIDGHEYRVEYGFEAIDNIDNVSIELNDGGLYALTLLIPNGYQIGNKTIISDGNDISVNFKANGSFILDFVKIYDLTTNTYVANVISHSDYYPFGMQMPGRNGNGPEYRYGFQGMEKDDEVKGEGNSYTTQFRQYDPRLGRWLSVEPRSDELPSQSPYNFCLNSPLIYTDPNGDFPWIVIPIVFGGYWIGESTHTTDEAYVLRSLGDEIGYRMKIRQSGEEVMEGIYWLMPATKFGRMAVTAYSFGTAYENVSQAERASSPAEKRHHQQQAGQWLTIGTLSYMLDRAFVYTASKPNLGERIKNWFKRGGKSQEKYRKEVLEKYPPTNGDIPTAARGAKVDLMGGKSGTPGYRNYDKQATNGIADDVSNFGKHYGPNSVSDLVVNNPQAAFLEAVTPSMQSGGRITLRGQFANKNFSDVWDASEISGYKVISRQRGVSSSGYTKTNGSPIKGSMNKIILEKL